MTPIRIYIDQNKEDPTQFIPSNLYPEAKEIFKLMGKDHLTAEELSGLRSIPVEFCLFGEDVPIGGKFFLYESCAVWYDKIRKRYFGRKRDHKGFLQTNKSAIGVTANDVFSRLTFKTED